MKSTEKQKRPVVTVVIPVFNRSAELVRAVKSVLSQTFRDFEIIVVDDGSSEEIEAVCAGFGDERIRYFRIEHKNANAARNKGIAEAKGEYVAMLDADDEFLPFHLERRLKKMGDWECDGIFGSARIFDGTKERRKRSRPLKAKESMADYLLTDGFCPTPSHFYRAAAVKRIHWDEELYRNQDYDFSIRFADRFVFVCDPRVTIRVHWHKGYKRKLGDVHFASQKRFIEKHKGKISQEALVNFYYSMRKEAEETGNISAYAFYDSELKKAATGINLVKHLLSVRLKAVVNRLKML
ncbi:MAG: glycosyltransferase family 2 protein [Chlorobi bacterium]|nr:glycosyltransferase family 2 protein [Chlorobiota bacterium]